MINLVVTTIVVMAVFTSYIMLNFDLKYFAGNMLTNSYVLGVGDLVAKLMGGVIFLFIGLKNLNLLCFGVGAIGSLALSLFHN